MKKNTTQPRAGFTLPEILITMGISVLVTGSTLVFFLYALNIFYYDAAKNLVNRDIRKFTSELSDNATDANYFQIYPNFSNRTATTGTITTSTNLVDRQSGDMLVLIYKDRNNVDTVNRIVGYYRAPVQINNVSSEGPVRKFDIRFNPGVDATTTQIHTLLPASSTYSTNPEVIELSKGLSSGRLFYNDRGRNILVNGEIIKRGGRGGTRYEYATNTYNFTVSPRG